MPMEKTIIQSEQKSIESNEGKGIPTKGENLESRLYISMKSTWSQLIHTRKF